MSSVLTRRDLFAEFNPITLNTPSGKYQVSRTISESHLRHVLSKAAREFAGGSPSIPLTTGAGSAFTVLASFLKTLTVQSMGRVEVIINGAEVLAR